MDPASASASESFHTSDWFAVDEENERERERERVHERQQQGNDARNRSIVNPKKKLFNRIQRQKTEPIQTRLRLHQSAAKWNPSGAIDSLF